MLVVFVDSVDVLGKCEETGFFGLDISGEFCESCSVFIGSFLCLCSCAFHEDLHFHAELPFSHRFI